MPGQHRTKPASPRTRLNRVFCWFCSEGKHILIELPVGMSAILLYELFLSPHGSENLHYITTVM